VLAAPAAGGNGRKTDGVVVHGLENEKPRRMNKG
jgi:hypothetical protein